MDPQHIHRRLGCFNFLVCDGLSLKVAAVSERKFSPRLIHEDPSHRLSRGGKEVAAAVPLLGLIDIDEANIRLMDKIGCLERLT
jgi:hypothetical protein